jgi:murein L,D-transpeptidase YafK
MRHFPYAYLTPLIARALLYLNNSNKAKVVPDIVPVPRLDTAVTVLPMNIPLSKPVDSIWVVKHQRRMYVYNKGQLQKVYHISLGSSPVGAKRFQGDRKTPEGLYYIDGKNPNSVAHKNLGVSYPNERDRKYARSKGKPTGGDIKIHGMMNGWEAEEPSYCNTDWTWGCIAVLNKDIDELYEYVTVGIPIYIVP